MQEMWQVGDSLKPTAGDRAAIDVTAWVSRLIDGFKSRQATVGIVGLGYVGLPLACAVARKGFSVLGVDIDDTKIARLNEGKSYLSDVKPDDVADFVRAGRLAATSDFSRLAGVGAVILGVPTPLTRQREPDLTFVRRTGEAIVPHLRRGQLVVLESTTYPGTTRDVLRPILERGGLRS